jgi:hypothetical protein
MARAQKLHLKDIKGSRSSFPAIRQLLVLVLTIIFGVLLSVSCNAQKTSEKKKLHYKAYKVKNRAKANHYAVQTELAPISKTVLLSNILQQQVIKEMVAQNLSENGSGNSIELAPLLFGIKDGRLTAIDVNPLLIAIEFGLQGKTILIESFGTSTLPMHQRLSYNDVREVAALMNEMGVPEERLSIVACNSELTGAHKARIDFKAI